MANAGRAKDPAQLPSNEDLSACRAALVDHEAARKFLVDRGVTDACVREFDFGVQRNELTLPIYGPGRDGEYELVILKRFEIGREQASKSRHGRGRHVFPWPLIGAWNYDNPVVITSDEISVAALTGIGQNAICTTAGVGRQKFEDLPIGVLKPAHHFIVAEAGTTDGLKTGKKLAFECKRAFPGARVTRLEFPIAAFTAARILGRSSDPSRTWDDEIDKGRDQEGSDAEGSVIYEAGGRLWRSRTKDDPECICDFDGKLVEQGRTVMAGIDTGRHWVFELTHSLSGETVKVEHRPEGNFYEDVVGQVGADFTFERRHGDAIRNYLTRKTGLAYTTRHRGWQFGFTKTDFDAFLTCGPVFKVGKSHPEKNDYFEMKAPHDTVDFKLPMPEGKEREALRLIWGDVIDMHHRQLTMPMLAATMLAPVRRILAIGHDPFMVFIQGPTGCGKTTRAKVFQSFFGDFWDSQKLLTFKHTVLWLAQIAAMAGDSILLMDDLNYDKMRDEDAKIIRGYLQGTAQGGSRQRLTRDFGVGEQTPTEYCTKVITCEVLPSGDQSMIARSLVIDSPHIDALDDQWRRPHDRVKVGRSLLPHAMTAWISWVMASPDRAREKFDEQEFVAKDEMKALFDFELGKGWGARRANFVRAFSRMSLFTAAFKTFANWSLETGGMDHDRHDEMLRAWDQSVVYDMLSSQTGALGEEGVANEMQMVIESALAAGRGALLDQRSSPNPLTTRANSNAPIIGFIEVVSDAMLKDPLFSENFAQMSGRKVIVGLHQGVAHLWNSAANMPWSKIKNYLEKAGEVVSMKTRHRRYLLCKRELATRIVACLGAIDLAREAETSDENSRSSD